MMRLPEGPAVSRADCWELGIRLREALIWKYMAEHGLRDRPLVKDVIDDLIRDSLGARMRVEPLPLDRYAQTEVVKGRVEITINSRIAEMKRVKDVAGAAYISKWHEIIHVPQDLRCPDLARRLAAPTLPGVESPALRAIGRRVVYCRGGPRGGKHSTPRVFIAENAAHTAAIAVPDLRRCPAFVKFTTLRCGRGGFSGWAWELLARTAAFLGVSRGALVEYLVQRGFVRLGRSGSRPRLMPTNSFYEGVNCLEPNSGPSRLIA